jgi:hypothetical protein
MIHCPTPPPVYGHALRPVTAQLADPVPFPVPEGNVKPSCDVILAVVKQASGYVLTHRKRFNQDSGRAVWSRGTARARCSYYNGPTDLQDRPGQYKWMHCVTNVLSPAYSVNDQFYAATWDIRYNGSGGDGSPPVFS